MEQIHTTKIPSENLIKNKFPIHWLMSVSEQTALVQLLEYIKPEISIEIGTYNGGSLQVLSAYSKKVYAFDIDAKKRDKQTEQLSNVEYIIGDSKITVPKLVNEINANTSSVGFVLIDGDHSQEGVLADITNILKLIPKTAITILLHDSFNPECRKGIRRYDYKTNPYIHSVDLDYITGVYFEKDNLKGEMWGGFAVIDMLPEKRKNTLIVKASQNKLYEIAYYRSFHFLKNIFWFLKPIYKVFKK